MLEAITNRHKEMMTPEEFSKKYKSEYQKEWVYPVCPNCERNLHLYGIQSPATKAAFHHPDGSDDCELSNPQKAKNFPSYDFSNDNIIKEFQAQENQRRSFSLCKNLLLNNIKFKYKDFYELIKISKKKNIFYYKGLEVWMIPYILLTLKDFKNEEKDFFVRFVMTDILVEMLSGKKVKNEIQKIEKSKTGTKTTYLEMNEDFFKSVDITWIDIDLNSNQYL